MIEKVAFFGR